MLIHLFQSHLPSIPLIELGRELLKAFSRISIGIRAFDLNICVGDGDHTGILAGKNSNGDCGRLIADIELSWKWIRPRGKTKMSPFLSLEEQSVFGFSCNESG